jgi:hypothetical protein
VKHRLALATFLVAIAPSLAAAQFTTFIPPQNKTKDSIKAAVVAEQKAVTDSVTRAQISDMKTWVDSAAGIKAPSNDSLGVTPMVPATTPQFSDGTIAPNTATSLPLLAALGLLALAGGIVLLRTDRKSPTPARSRR